LGSGRFQVFSIQQAAASQYHQKKQSKPNSIFHAAKYNGETGNWVIGNWVVNHQLPNHLSQINLLKMSALPDRGAFQSNFP
jgi:hypothetical protein